MRRIVWISVALLIMVGIMGYAMFTMRNIEEVNKRRHEQDAGKDVAVIIAATTETTSVWDALRATETATGTDTSESTTGLPQFGNESHTTEPAEEMTVEDFSRDDEAVSEPDTQETQTTVLTIIVP
jgi:hypothetical protein